MTILTSRQIEFVRLLMLENEYRPIRYFTTPLKTSDKTLQKDLKIIEKYLEKFEIELDAKPGSGILLNKSTKNHRLLLNDLQFKESDVKKFSINERRFEIIKILLSVSNMETSIQKLSDKYYVSKASIANDLKYVEDWINKFELTLCKTISGTKVVGQEVNIRKAIAALVQDYSNTEDKKIQMQKLSFRLDISTLKGLQELFDNEKILYVSSLIENLEKQYSYQMGDPYYINLLSHILISLKRGAEGKLIENFTIDNYQLIKSDKSYEAARWLVSQINQFYNIELPESEVYYVYQYFITSGFQEKLAEFQIVDKGLYNNSASDITKSLISYMCSIINKDLLIDETILDGLVLHIRPMLNRLNYNIQIRNPLLSEIIEQYNESLNICKAAVLLLVNERKLKNISLDEIGYLTMYFQAALERTTLKRRIIVVCQSGYGTSQLLVTKLKKAFPQWEIVDVLSARKLKERDMKDIDLVISTVHLDISEKPYILVSAFLSEKDIDNISRLMKEDTFIKTNDDIRIHFINDILQEGCIFFNYSSQKVMSSLSDGNTTNYKFEEICFGANVKVYICFCSNEKSMILSLNDKEDNKREISFYLTMNDSNLILNILTEIYHLYQNEHSMYYLKRCNKVRDVKNYFALNKGERDVKTMDLAAVIRSETIKLEMNARNKDEAIRELTQMLYDADKIANMEDFIEDVYYREKIGVTGIGNGFAIPHGKSKFVKKTCLAIGRTKCPIEWDSLDDQPVNFIILFAVTDEDKTSNHIRLLSQVATKLGDDEICERLKLANTSNEIYNIFAGNGN
ncbi:transcription antitermination protein BlgG [Clostridium zeae]|uniref:Transcription antitermination protein BlgG n=1 Tax=Clostridium zeae TaxID=2759022 RepID=A0ABQ1E5A7_9CLOT|nr:BglG family transcription antiterminator [Clostridium zeae]GFZ29914.1 transcription antitermination protein BlgG [Clostridium zeae]